MLYLYSIDIQWPPWGKKFHMLQTLGDCSVKTVQFNCDYIMCVTLPIHAVNTLLFPLLGL